MTTRNELIEEIMEKQSIKVRICSKTDSKKHITIMDSYNVFKSLQDVVYSVGDHLMKNPPRPQGPFPSALTDLCDLTFAEVNMGSLTATLQLAQGQMGIPGMETLGERIIARTNEIIHVIGEEDKPEKPLEKIIDNPTRLNRIIRDIDTMWPDEKAKHEVTISHRRRENCLSPKRKPIIESLLRRPVEEGEKVLTGRLIEYRVDKRRHFDIDTPEGIVSGQYAPELERSIKRNMGSLVRLHCSVKDERNRETFFIDRENSVDRMETLHISYFTVGEVDYTLRESLKVEVVFANEQYTLSNDEFGLMAIADNIKAAITEIREQLAMHWEDYVKDDERNLNWDAIEFKKKLIALVE